MKVVRSGGRQGALWSTQQGWGSGTDCSRNESDQRGQARSPESEGSLHYADRWPGQGLEGTRSWLQNDKRVAGLTSGVCKLSRYTGP